IAGDGSKALAVPESESAIDAINYSGCGFFPSFALTANRLYVLDIIGGPSQIRVFDHKGKQLGKVPLPPLTSVRQLVAVDQDAILFRLESFVEPGAWYRYDPVSGKIDRTALVGTSPAKFDDCVVEQKFAVSKDGTKVPIHIVRLKSSTLNG